MLIEARSNVGPIAFGTTSVDGYIDVSIDGDTIDIDTAAPAAELQVDLNTLRSGNPLYDAELLRRVDARHYPRTVVSLTAADRIDASERYELDGELTFHGVTREISGTVSATVGETGEIVIAGEHVFDIRDFNIVAPNVLMLRIYPDVRVQLQVAAIPEDD